MVRDNIIVVIPNQVFFLLLIYLIQERYLQVVSSQEYASN